jgi:hypothetical protein
MIDCTGRGPVPTVVATRPFGSGTLLSRVSPCVAAGPVPASAEPAKRRCSGAVAGGATRRHHRGDTGTTNHVRDRPCAGVRGGPGAASSPRPRRRRNIGAWRALPTACTRRAATGIPRGDAGTAGTFLQRHCVLSPDRLGYCPEGACTGRYGRCGLVSMDRCGEAASMPRASREACSGVRRTKRNVAAGW